MKEDLVEVDVGVGLSDSELITYEYRKSDDMLKIEIRAWDASKVKIICINPILFIDRGCDAITMLCERLSHSGLLEEALEKNYDKGVVPAEHPYKLYQLMNLDDEPSIEFVCKGIEKIRIK